MFNTMAGRTNYQRALVRACKMARRMKPPSFEDWVHLEHDGSPKKAWVAALRWASRKSTEEIIEEIQKLESRPPYA